MPRHPSVVILILLSLFVARTASAQVTVEVVAERLIAEGIGGLDGQLFPRDAFGRAVCALGDVNGDGVVDLAVGAPFEEDPPGPGTQNTGSVWILLMNADGTVAGGAKLGASTPALQAAGLAPGDRFGSSVAALGDLDGDGVPDLAVGAAAADGAPGPRTGAVWILRLASDGSLLAADTIDTDWAPLAEALDARDAFGTSVASLGDVDGDGTVEIAVGAIGDDGASSPDRPAVDAGVATGEAGEESDEPDRGAVWVVSVTPDATPVQLTRLGDDPELDDELAAKDAFGASLAALGDVDGDGIAELAVGSDPSRFDPLTETPGAIWRLELDAALGLVGARRIEAFEIVGASSSDGFGSAVVSLGDLNEDDVADLAVGVPRAAPGGRVWVSLLRADGTVLAAQVLDEEVGLSGPIPDGAGFGAALTGADIDGDGTLDLVVGAPQTDALEGAVWIEFLDLSEFSGQEPFVPLVGALEGRAGRPTLLLPPPDGPGDDAIDDPVVVVPKESGNTVSARAASENQGFLLFAETDEFGVGEAPTMATSAGFSNGTVPTGTVVLESIVTSNRDSDSFSFLRGQDLPDEPPFAPQVEYPLPDDTSPIAIVAGVFGPGSSSELGVAVAGAEGVTTFAPDGGGGFVYDQFVPVPNPTDLAVGDFDGNGRDDLLVAGGALAAGPGLESGSVTVLLADASGLLSVAGTFADGAAVASVLTIDADLDGVLDVFVAAHEFDGGPNGVPQGRLSLWIGDGAGGFMPSPVFADVLTPSVEGIHPTYGDVADVNADGFPDAVYATSDNISFPPEQFDDDNPPISLTVLLNDHAGGFSVANVGTAYAGKGVAPLLEDLVPAATDGLVDCVLVWYEDALAGVDGVAKQWETFIAVLVGDGLGGFEDPAPNQFLTGDQPANPAVAELGDPSFAGAEIDGAPDVLVPNLGSNSLSILTGDGAGGVASTLEIAGVDEVDPRALPPFFQGGPSEVHTADFDGDGRTDALVYNQWLDASPIFPTDVIVASLSLYRGVGGGEFVKTQYLPLPTGGSVAVADVVGDSAPDVVLVERAGSAGPGAVHVYRGLGDGTLVRDGAPIDAPGGLGLTGGVYVADLLGLDGEPEIATTAIGTVGDGLAGSLVVYTAERGVWSAEVFDADGAWERVRSLDVGDLSGDGVPDVAIGTRDGALHVAASVPFGTGGEGFVPLALSAEAAQVGGGALRIGELNGDGRLDVVSSNSGVGSVLDKAFVRSLLNGGSGDFELKTTGGLSSVGAQGSLRPVLADMNGDGATDVVLVHGAANAVSILINELNTFEAAGGGKSGSGGFTPALGGTGYTAADGQLTLELERGLGGAAGLLRVGTTLLEEEPSFVVGDVVFEMLIELGGEPGRPGDGEWSMDGVLRAAEGLVGTTFVVQVLVVDPGALEGAPAGLAASNGLTFIVQP